MDPLIAAPRRANKVSDCIPLIPSQPEAITTINAAPELTPNKLGEAIGLRVMTCMIAPAIARLAPTTAAIRARGTRTVRMIKCSCDE
ncbi:hypothetical protein D3C76_1270550 [compost metagenome]